MLRFIDFLVDLLMALFSFRNWRMFLVRLVIFVISPLMILYLTR